MAVRVLLCLAILTAICPSMASTAESKPDIYLIQYQAFQPSLWFTGNEGPDAAIFTTVQSEPEWKKLWAELEPRLPRDMHQSAPHPFPRIDFIRQTLLVAALGTKPTGGFSLSVQSITASPTSITVNLVALNPGKGCGDVINSITQITTHPIALLLIAKTSKPVQFDTMQVEPLCN